MKTQEFPIPLKNRLDVVDTALLQQKEKQALKWLLILLVLTVVYESKDFLWSSLSMPEFPVPEVNASLRRTFPSRRVGRLIQTLQAMQAAHPLTRDALLPLIDDLLLIKDQDPARVGQAMLQNRLSMTLNRLWEVFHSPLWEDRKPFEGVIQEIRALFTLLRETPPEQLPVPVLPVGPRPLLPLESPARHLFRFAHTPSRPGLSEEPRK